MKIIFIINQRGSFRYFSTLITEGINKGHEVELWHCYFTNIPGIEVEYSPFIDNRSIIHKKLNNRTDLIVSLSVCEQVDYFVDMHPVHFKLNTNLYEIISGKWCIIQHGIDSFAEVWHWQALYNGIELLQDYKKLFFPYTQAFYNSGVEWLRKYEDQNGIGNYKFFENNKTKVYPIGCPMYNSSHMNIDHKMLRIKYGIPPNKGLLIYLPFPFYPARASGNYAWEASFAGIYLGYKSFENGNIKNSFIVFVRSFFKKIIFLSKIFCDKEAVIWLFHRWSEPSVIKTIRRFCDKNNMHLVVKPKKNFPFSNEVYRCADIIIDDDQKKHYPSKLQELLTISDLAMGYQTTAVFESVLNGIPFINIECPRSFFNNDEAELNLHNYDEGSMYNIKGVVNSMNIPSLINTFHDKNKEDFKIDLKSRENYMEKFLGQDSPTAAERFYDILKKIKNQDEIF